MKRPTVRARDGQDPEKALLDTLFSRPHRKISWTTYYLFWNSKGDSVNGGSTERVDLRMQMWDPEGSRTAVIWVKFRSTESEYIEEDI